VTARSASQTSDEVLEGEVLEVDVVVVGAGFSGLYMLHRLREMGFSAHAFEAADGVGGTWYWNRYPGARCDVQSIDYAYTFDAELEAEWRWSERYATQPEILEYLNHVTDRFDLRRDITFSSKVAQAEWDEVTSRWNVTTQNGRRARSRFYVVASGCLSHPKNIDIEGVDRFAGEVYHTHSWPHEQVDFSGKRVAVIGTGSSGVQSIPVIAESAGSLTVFQRTPNFSIPAHNGPVWPEKAAELHADRDAYHERARWSRAGVPGVASDTSALDVTDEERKATYETAWRAGEIQRTLFTYNDLLLNEDANATLSDFLRNKIRAKVDDPVVADLLCPTNHPFGTKRPCLDSNYFETYNMAHVRLVDLQAEPIEMIDERGIRTSRGSYEFDVIVFATGFDAVTGAIVAVDIRGRDGRELKTKWEAGPLTYLGLTVEGFPNLFLITGPGSPSVLSNMTVSIEQHADWIADCLEYMREAGAATIEATSRAETGWVSHVNDVASLSLHHKANSWYMGANVPGKPRVFLPYVGGAGNYRKICDEVVEQDYLGFTFDGTRCADGVIRQVQPDVAGLLAVIDQLDLAPVEKLTPVELRAQMAALATHRPPGPEVGEIVDGTLIGPDGELNYRLYRPPTEGPHPVVAYFHGGGWVFGDVAWDEPLCRELCVRSDVIIVSVEYRLAPEASFPAAARDAFAALQWIESEAESLGGLAGKLAVAGFSAGGNLAAVVAQTARDAGGPTIAGQLLLNAVLDCDLSRPSYDECATGFVLTAAAMSWYWDQYAAESDRIDPLASPLRNANLAGLPSTFIMTSQFDPLRDEGAAYAAALAEAGVVVDYVEGRGQIHTSVGAVGVLRTAAALRDQAGDALRGFFAES
jgi:cation diffusion facilitator CzcD-associated flavoprotein CzcO/acetyl esterase/lipase